MRRSGPVVFIAVIATLVGLAQLAPSCVADRTGATCETARNCPVGQACTAANRCDWPVECAACSGADDLSCGSGAVCLRRLCDAQWACHPADGGELGIELCTTVDGGACPEVPNFGVCTEQRQCAPGSICTRGRCYQPCQGHKDCLIPDFKGKRLAGGRCVGVDGGPWCHQACRGADHDEDCPEGLACAVGFGVDGGHCSTACHECSVANPTCPEGTTCKPRQCDGISGCFPQIDSRCATIGGKHPPRVCNYGSCTHPSDCGSLSMCTPSAGSSGSRCIQQCVQAAECREGNISSGYTPVCVAEVSHASSCHQVCLPDGGCASNATCTGVQNSVRYCVY